MAVSMGFLRLTVAGLALTAVAACEGGLDFDLRDRLGDNFSTREAALRATQARPKPDDRGVLSYPNYQVAVARRGDTVATVAARVGLPALELARYNGMQPEDGLRAGEIVALPRRVAEPSPQTGAATTGPIRPTADVSVTELASNAIDSAEPTPPRETAQPQTGVEPIRHKVRRGETAFTIARAYGIPVRALADWNGLDAQYTLREGQYLLIPPATAVAKAPDEDDSAPGAGSQTPVPPSASKPLPEDTTPAVGTPAPAAPPAPKLETSKPAASAAKMTTPVQGRIIREYVKGKTDGIDFSAPAGTAVKAADSGIVAAVTSNADNIPIVVLKHADNILTVYANIGDLTVSKDDRVSRGQTIGKMRAGNPPYLHFEVRRGFDSVDPAPFLN